MYAFEIARNKKYEFDNNLKRGKVFRIVHSLAVGLVLYLVFITSMRSSHTQGFCICTAE